MWMYKSHDYNIVSQHRELGMLVFRMKDSVMRNLKLCKIAKWSELTTQHSLSQSVGLWGSTLNLITN